MGMKIYNVKEFRPKCVYIGLQLEERSHKEIQLKYLLKKGQNELVQNGGQTY